jgi:hypothetical protein
MSNKRKINPNRNYTRQPVPVRQMKPMAVVTAPLSEREGVYVHAFKCLTCGLEFNTHSWLADRHQVGAVGCPECGERVRLNHWRAILSDSATFGSGGIEIFMVSQPKGSALMNDSWALNGPLGR